MTLIVSLCHFTVTIGVDIEVSSSPHRYELEFSTKADTRQPVADVA